LNYRTEVKINNENKMGYEHKAYLSGKLNMDTNIGEQNYPFLEFNFEPSKFIPLIEFE